VLFLVLLGCARSQEGGRTPGGAVSAVFSANVLRPGAAVAATSPPVAAQPGPSASAQLVPPAAVQPGPSAANAAPSAAPAEHEVVNPAPSAGPSSEPLPSPMLSAVPATARPAASAQRVTGKGQEAAHGRFDAAVVLAAPHAPPRILAIALSATTVRGGETVVGQVRTTSNVASVEIRVQGFSTVMTRRSVGDFTLHYPVPMLPPWLHRTYPVVVIARNVDGLSETRTLEVTVE
jgi:hypothetical protein